MSEEHPDPHAGHNHGGHLPPEQRQRSRLAERGLRNLLLGIVVPLAIATIVGLVTLWPSGERTTPPELQGAADQVSAKVVTSERGPCPDEQGGAEQRCQVALIRLRGGPDEGTTAPLVFNVEANPGISTLHAGDGVIVQRVEGATGTFYAFVDLQRSRPLLALAIGFSILVVALARWKGLAALGGLAVTLVVLVRFVLPSILDGHDPVAVSVVGSSVILFVVFYLAHGVTIRSTTALVGTLVSLGITGLLATYVVGAAHLSGAGSEESLIIRATAGQINLRGLLLGGVIIGGLGVLNDVTITQSSAVWQLALTDPDASWRRLYRQGMAIGRDHIGATVDTLVLAYAGAAMPLLVLFTLADRSLSQVLTSSAVAEEVVRSLVGAVGLVLSVPLTTGLAAVLSAGAAKRS